MLALEWPLGEKAQRDIDDKKRKPSREIRVEAMRDAVEFAQRTSGRGRGKVVLVYPAERMNHVTANALLKTLEEPPGDLRFVLASESAQQLLPTIRSRCLSHTMPWPNVAAGVALAGRARCGRAWRPPACCAAAGGRPDDALALHLGGGARLAGRACPGHWLRGDADGLGGLTGRAGGQRPAKPVPRPDADPGRGAALFSSRKIFRAGPHRRLSVAALSDWSRAWLGRHRTASNTPTTPA